jgi:phage protein D
MPLDAPAATFTGMPAVRVAGQMLPTIVPNIARMAMREQLGGLSNLELTLNDVLSFADGTAGYGATAQSPLQLGAAIEIGMTMDANSPPQQLFKGTVTAIECENGPETSPLFTLLAEDGLWKARKTRKSRVFEQKSPADIARTIAGDHGLTPDIRDGLDQPVADWVQANESDLAFLRRILARFDADVLAVEDKMQVGGIDPPRNTLRLVQGDTLLRARITADLADVASEVRVGSFDPASGQAVSETASSGTMGPGQGHDGPSLLKPLLDPVREHVGHQSTMTSSEAQALAKALYSRRARGFVRVVATAQGNAGIRVGTHVTIAGVNPFFENVYCVTEATHRFDTDRGYLTEFRAEGAYLGNGA